MKENQTNWGNSLSQCFSYPLPFLNKTHILKLGQLCGSHMIFFSTLTFMDQFPYTFFPNTITGATFGSFCVFHTDIHKLHLLLGVCEERHAHMAILVSSKHFPKISSLSLTYDFKHACTDVVKEKVKYIHFKH